MKWCIWVLIKKYQFPFVASKLYCTFFLYLVARSAAVFTEAFARKISLLKTWVHQWKVCGKTLTSKQWLSSKIISVHFDCLPTCKLETANDVFNYLRYSSECVPKVQLVFPRVGFPWVQIQLQSLNTLRLGLWRTVTQPDFFIRDGTLLFSWLQLRLESVI